MAIQYRAAQASPPLPDIPAPSNLKPVVTSGSGRESILFASPTAALITDSSPLAISSTLTPTSSPSPTSQPPTASPSATPAPAAHNGMSAGKIVAIVVPIVVIVLAIPIMFLLYRGHKMKKRGQKRSSVRSSNDPMIEAEEKPLPPPGPAPARPRRAPERDVKEKQAPRPSNSLGLFDFDLSAPATPALPSSPPRLSVARALQMQRSEVSVIHPNQGSARQSDGRRSNNSAGSARGPTNASEVPPPPYTSPQATQATQVSHFAPLQSIGTARPSTDTSRPTPQRKRSSFDAAVQNASKELPKHPEADGKATPRLPSPVSSGYRIPSFGLGMGGRFSLGKHDRRSDVSGLSFDPNWLTDDHRRSNVSAIDSDEHLGTRSHQIL